ILLRQQSCGVRLGLGLSILAATRPYDFLVIGVIACAAIAWCWWRKQLPSRAALAQVLLAAAVLAITGAGMPYHNYRVTRDPLTLPYLLHDRQYAATSLFIWSKPHAQPVYRHAVMRKFWTEWFMNSVQLAQRDPAGAFFSRLSVLYGFFFGFWPFLIP